MKKSRINQDIDNLIHPILGYKHITLIKKQVNDEARKYYRENHDLPRDKMAS